MRGHFYGVLFLLVGLVGCGGGTPSASNGGGSSGSPDDGAPTGIKTRSISDLPAVDEPLAAMDQGRVQISLPTGWKTLTRNPKFLLACVPEEGSATKLPRISVTVSDPPEDIKTSTTADNVQEVADVLQAQLKKEKKLPIESCKPLILGSNAWVRNVRKSTFKDDPVAIQYLQTVQSGRLYTIDLTVTAKDNPRSSVKPIIYEKSLSDHRDFAYAVAANMKFPKESGGGAASPPPAEEKPAEKPAEKATEKATEKPASKSK